MSMSLPRRRSRWIPFRMYGTCSSSSAGLASWEPTQRISHGGGRRARGGTSRLWPGGRIYVDSKKVGMAAAATESVRRGGYERVRGEGRGTDVDNSRQAPRRSSNRRVDPSFCTRRTGWSASVDAGFEQASWDGDTEGKELGTQGTLPSCVDRGFCARYVEGSCRSWSHFCEDVQRRNEGPRV